MAKVYDNATDLITFARLQSQNTTSGSSYLGSDGLLKFAAEDEPRIEYGSDGSLKGLLIEEQRTNLVTYSTSDAATPTNWAAPAGAGAGTRTLTTLSNGLSGLRFQASAERPYIQQAVTLNVNKTYTLSVYVEAGYTAGTRPVLLISGLAGYTGTINASLGSEDSNGRISVTFTTGSDVTCNIRYGLGTDTNDTGDVTLGGIQLEEGSFATSYIPTSGSQSTRSPDIASIPVTAFGYNQKHNGTFLVEWVAPSNRDGRALSVTDVQGTAGRLLDINGSYSGNRIDVYSNHTVGALYGLTPYIAGDINKVAATMGENNSAACANGGTVRSDTTTTAPINPNYINLGAYGGAYINSHIKSLQYFPRRLTDAQLQELTA